MSGAGLFQEQMTIWNLMLRRSQGRLGDVPNNNKLNNSVN